MILIEIRALWISERENEKILLSLLRILFLKFTVTEILKDIIKIKAKIYFYY